MPNKCDHDDPEVADLLPTLGSPLEAGPGWGPCRDGPAAPGPGTGRLGRLRTGLCPLWAGPQGQETPRSSCGVSLATDAGAVPGREVGRGSRAQSLDFVLITQGKPLSQAAVFAFMFDR